MDLLRRTVAAAYPTARFDADGPSDHALQITFPDLPFTFDLVPALAGDGEIVHIAHREFDRWEWVGGDTFMVNGQRVPYVRNSRFEARRTAKLLTAAGAGPVTVTRVVAVMGARGGYTVKTQPAGVVVVTRKEVGKWLARQPDVLTDDQVDAVYAAARKASPWR